MIFLRILILGIICAALQFFYPWWTMAIAAFVLGFVFGQKAYKSFLTGLFGVGIVWLSYAIFLNTLNDGILSHKIAELLGLGSIARNTGLSQGILLIIFTSLIGGIIAGLSCISGGFLRDIFKKKP